MLIEDNVVFALIICTLWFFFIEQLILFTGREKEHNISSSKSLEYQNSIKFAVEDRGDVNQAFQFS